jgi:superoxide dismutase, Fe-Mn family
MIHRLPGLPYAISALEPHISARTMHVHHQLHHASSVAELNNALQLVPETIRAQSARWLLLNHSCLWQTMTPGGGYPSGMVSDAINQAFGCMSEFKRAFEVAGNQVIGSGWVWLVRSPFEDLPLRIITTRGDDAPIVQGYEPLLGNDVWEHAYYRQFENRRAEYLRSWWSVVDWRRVEARLSADQNARVESTRLQFA